MWHSPCCARNWLRMTRQGGVPTIHRTLSNVLPAFQKYPNWHSSEYSEMYHFHSIRVDIEPKKRIVIVVLVLSFVFLLFFVVLCSGGQSLPVKQYCIDTAALVYTAVTITDNCESVNKHQWFFNFDCHPPTTTSAQWYHHSNPESPIQKKRQTKSPSYCISASEVHHRFAKLLCVSLMHLHLNIKSVLEM